MMIGVVPAVGSADRRIDDPEPNPKATARRKPLASHAADLAGVATAPSSAGTRRPLRRRRRHIQLSAPDPAEPPALSQSRPSPPAGSAAYARPVDNHRGPAASPIDQVGRPATRPAPRTRSGVNSCAGRMDRTLLRLLQGVRDPLHHRHRPQRTLKLARTSTRRPPRLSDEAASGGLLGPCQQDSSISFSSSPTSRPPAEVLRHLRARCSVRVCAPACRARISAASTSSSSRQPATAPASAEGRPRPHEPQPRQLWRRPTPPPGSRCSRPRPGVEDADVQARG